MNGEPVRMRATKIVCTVGPASLSLLDELLVAGMDVARLNFSHGTPEMRADTVARLRSASERHGRSLAILGDLPGPKIRLGSIAGDAVMLTPGGRFVLRPRGTDDEVGDVDGTTSSHPDLGSDVRTGDRLFLADGAVELEVIETGRDVVTRVVRGGTVRSRSGIGVPAERLSMPAITDADRRGLEEARALGLDMVAQSFVRSAADVRELRALMADAPLPIVAKIETRPAVEDAAAILREVEAVMVARGDLGVQVGFEEIPILQKELVAAALAAGVPTIVATQMLESMTAAPRPTRAEASDVANAVLDGADAVMLSGETAIGRFPVEATEAAARISALADANRHLAPPHTVLELAGGGGRQETIAVARAAGDLASAVAGVRAIACYTESGWTAALLAAVRPDVPIVALSPHVRVLRTLALRHGVLPLAAEPPTDTDALIAMIDRRLIAHGLALPGDSVVIVAAAPPVERRANLVTVHRVGLDADLVAGVVDSGDARSSLS